MGTQVPPENPPLLTGKWYHVTTDRYTPTLENPGCTLPQTLQNCCRLGQDIQSYINSNWDCTEHVLCSPPVVSAERLRFWSGPFDTFAECQLDL